LRATLRERAEKEGAAALYAELKELDPSAAARIQPTDVRRIIRALEVKKLTGQRISERGKGTPLYRALQIGLIRERQRLYAAIDARVDEMIERGLIEEAKWLFAQGYPENLPVFQALGYKEMIPYLRGEATLEEARAILKRETRRFAKRQLTWFRRDKRILWLDRDAFSREEDLVEEIVRLAEGKLLSDHECNE
jgi:tRNA dimethylallyltransferase